MQKQWLGGNTEGKKPGYYKRKNNARKQHI